MLERLINKLLFNYRLKKAVKKADEFANLRPRKYLVIMYKGKPLVISKQKLKLWKTQKKFKKGITLEQIEKGALYITQ